MPTYRPLALLVLCGLLACEPGPTTVSDAGGELALPEMSASLLSGGGLVNGDFEDGDLSLGWSVVGHGDRSAIRVDEGGNHVARIDVGDGPGPASCSSTDDRNAVYVQQVFNVPSESVLSMDFRLPTPAEDLTETATCDGFDIVELNWFVQDPVTYSPYAQGHLQHQYLKQLDRTTDRLHFKDNTIESNLYSWADDLEARQLGPLITAPTEEPGWWFFAMNLTDPLMPALPDEVRVVLMIRNEEDRYTGQDFELSVDNVRVITGGPSGGDLDGDGIEDDIDTEPEAFSDFFWSLDGGGQITDRGDQFVWVFQVYVEDTDEVVPDVFTIGASNPDGGGAPAQVTVDCPDGSTNHFLDSDEWIYVECGSISTKVTQGPVDAEFVGTDGSRGTAELGTGQAVTFHGESFTFDAPDENAEPVVVKVEGAAYEVVPGKSLRVASIDIKPGSEDNPVNLRSGGVIPVALLTTPLLDAGAVDLASLAFGPGGASPAHRGGHLEDVDGDGDLDLLLHFPTRETGLGSDDRTACLEGVMPQGGELRACDEVTVLRGR